MSTNKKTTPSGVASKRILKITPRRKAPPALASALDEIEHHVRRYVVFPSDKPDDETMTVGQAQSTVTTLWVAHAVLLHEAAFHVTPRLLITSAEPASGKTTLGDVIAQLTDALATSNITAPALYRTVDAGMASVIFCDEFDAIYGGVKSEGNEDLRKFFNGGYKRGSHVIRCAGNSHDPHKFETFAAVVMAGLDSPHFPETIVSRSVPIRLKAKLSSEHVENFVSSKTEEEADRLRELLRTWCSSCSGCSTLSRDKVTGLDKLHNRQLEIAEPLHAIAQAAGGEWPERSREALLLLLATRSSSESMTVRLLRDIYKVFKEEKTDRLSTTELLEALHEDESSPWVRYRPGRSDPSLNAIDLAQILSRHEIGPKKMRKGRGTVRGYLRSDFTDAWQRHVNPFLRLPASSPGKTEHPEQAEPIPDHSTGKGHRPRDGHDARRLLSEIAKKKAARHATR